MVIVNMNQLSKQQINQAAKILSDSLPLGWATLEDALTEIDERLVPENTILAAMEDDVVIGWGGILEPIYNGNVFELHPLAVRVDKRNQGIGSALVAALEDAAEVPFYHRCYTHCRGCRNDSGNSNSGKSRWRRKRC